MKYQTGIGQDVAVLACETGQAFECVRCMSCRVKTLFSLL